MKYHELLNHKSILECENERDREQHAKDVNSMISKLDDFAKYGAVVKKQQVDKAHANSPAEYQVVSADSLMIAVEGCDIKNGTDFVIHENTLGVVAYGQNYTFKRDKVSHTLETLCSYHFLDESVDFDSVADMKRQELAELYKDESKFLNTDKLLEDLRGVKKKDLDSIIKNAEARLSNNKGISKEQERETHERG